DQVPDSVAAGCSLWQRARTFLSGLLGWRRGLQRRQHSLDVGRIVPRLLSMRAPIHVRFESIGKLGQSGSILRIYSLRILFGDTFPGRVLDIQSRQIFR